VSDCLFCAIASGDHPAEIVLADEVAVAFLDSRPVFKGHVLVIPRDHYETLADLPAGLVGPLFTRVQRVSAALPAALGAQGTFVALNNVVSQSVPHLHVHVVPRTRGDGLRGFFWPRQKVRRRGRGGGVRAADQGCARRPRRLTGRRLPHRQSLTLNG
jgi:histidine triad (HIT) family protein